MSIFDPERDWVKLEIFVPTTHTEAVQEALHKSGAGQSGNYDYVFAISEVTGSFRPLEGSHAFTGTVGEISRVTEHKIEVSCPEDILDTVVEAVREAHPYEVPAINVFRLV